MTAWLDDLRTRVSFAKGSASLLLAVVEHDAVIDEARRHLAALLQATPLSVVDLGVGSLDAGPRRWAELTKAGGPADAYLLGATPSTPLGLGAMVRLYNAERELLRQLAGPLVLVVSSATDKAMRRESPDFFTWVAHGYELPSARELAALAREVAPTVVAPAPEEEPIRFLHVSDLHLGPGAVKRYDQDRVLRGLVDFLARDREVFPLDLLFVTGDLANAGKAEEYALVAELLRKLMEVTGVPPARVFVIPGNHDVDRDVGRWLLRTLTKDEDSIAFFEDAKSRTYHLQKLRAYGESMRALLGEERPLGLAVGEEAVEIVDVRGARLAVASFNSAWFAQGDDDHGKLLLGEPNVDRAGQRVADEEALFALALMHHPLDDLAEIERDNVERYLERSFDMVVRGHLHKDKTRAIATQRGGYVELAGPAAYQGSKWPNGCFLGEIRAKARTVRLRPYAYASGADGWVLDTKVFPDDEGDGYCHTFTVPEKRRMKGAVIRRLETAAEQAVRGASPAKQRKLAEELGIGRPGNELQRDMTRQTARAARSRVGDPVLVRRIWGSLTPQEMVVALTSTMIAELREDSPRVPTASPRFLEHALALVGRAFLRAKATLGGEQILANVAVKAIEATLAAILDPPHVAQAQLAIFLGTAENLGVIDVMQQGVSLQSALPVGLTELDLYFATGRYTYGALVIIDALSPTETEPHVEHASTPAGRDVLVLRI